MGKAALQWTDDMLAQLGKEKDAVLAERWGTTGKTVNLKRNALGIPAFGHVQWTPEMLAALGTDSDAALAKRWGMSKASVLAKRKELGIASTSEQQGGHLTGRPRPWHCWARHRTPRWLSSWA